MSPLNAKELTSALDGTWTGTQGTARCPAHDDKNPSLSISENPKDGNPLVKCHAGCGQEDVIDVLKRRGLWAGKSKKGRWAADLPRIKSTKTGSEPEPPTPGSEPQPRKTKTELAQDIWGASLPAAGTKVSVYLTSRGITIPPPDSLRFHPHLWHAHSKTHFPGMVAQITNSTSGEPIGIHRTYLAPDGNGKAPVESAKMMLGPAKDGVVRLGEPLDDGVLMIGEGIETCLSAMQVMGGPAWCALSAGGLQNLELPSGDYKVIILADSDKTGEEAAQAAAARWVEGDGPADTMTRCEIRDVSIARPQKGKDLNDLLREPNGVETITSIIDSAEKIKDPLDDLVNKAKKDPGEALKGNVIDAIARKIKTDRNGRAWYESTRSQLKSGGRVRVTELDNVISKKLGTGINKKEETQIEVLEDIVKMHEEKKDSRSILPY